MTNIYWANIRNQNKVFSYLEVTDLENGKWSVILDDQEITVKTDSTDFWEILTLALAKRPRP